MTPRRPVVVGEGSPRGYDSLCPHLPPWELTCDACSCSPSVTACLLTSRSRVWVGSNIASWWGNGVSTALGVERLVLRMGGSYPPCAGSAVMVLRAALRLTFIEGDVCLGDSRSLLITYVAFMDVILHMLTASIDFGHAVFVYTCGSPP